MVKNGASFEQMRYAPKSQKQLNNVSKPAFRKVLITQDQPEIINRCDIRTCEGLKKSAL